MAYIQLSALGLQAVVRHGNTLSGEYWEHRATPQLRLFHQWLVAQPPSHRLVAAMRAVLAGSAHEEPETSVPSGTLFDLVPFAGERLTKKRASRLPDVVLERQMDLFDA